jgi:DNA topoisomerase-1
VRFCFRGKSGQEHALALTDAAVARILKQCRQLRGCELFRYINEDGQPCALTSEDVNNYLREITGTDFTAKDFRTWAGTTLAARELAEMGPPRSQTAVRKNVVAAVKRVAQRLGNRPAACRKYYIHPAVLDSYSDASLFPTMQQGVEQHLAYGKSGLQPEEHSAMVLIAEDHTKEQPGRGQRRGSN